MEYQHIVRVASTDLDGKKQISIALKKIKGVSNMMANAICTNANIPKNKKTGDLRPEDVKALDRAIVEIEKNTPKWMLNRRKDPETGANMHIIGPDVSFIKDNDIKVMKKTKSYKGLRHQKGLPVRGQKTKANFRRNKGRGSLGVKRKK